MKPGVDKENNWWIHVLFKTKIWFLSYVTPIFTSATTGKRLDEIFYGYKIKETKRVTSFNIYRTNYTACANSGGLQRL